MFEHFCCKDGWGKLEIGKWCGKKKFENQTWTFIIKLDKQISGAMKATDHLPTTVLGCHHIQVDLSAPTILPPRVRVLNTPSTHFSFTLKLVLYLSCEKNKKYYHKWVRVWPILTNQWHHLLVNSCNWFGNNSLGW